MKFELNNLPINCSDEMIIKEIKRVDALVNKPTLTQYDFDQHGKIHSNTLTKRYGSWQHALALAGIEDKYGLRKVFRQQRQRKATDSQISVEFRRIAEILGKEWLTKEDWNNYSKILSTSAIEHRFGSWSTALKKAGLKVSPSGRRYTHIVEDYFENLLNVWTYYGKQPPMHAMDSSPSKISRHAYLKRFGSWRKALEAFVDRMNQDEQKIEHIFKEEIKMEREEQQEILKPPEIIKPRILVEDRRGIGLSLRYKVLNRDKFKCIKCGTSPATDHSCRLHVDHIIPFSKNGKTVLENLQTLCEMCNLGKGNRHFE